jgi:alpha-amylase
MSDEAQVTIRFLIDVDKHTNVRVVGNIDALGQWTPASGLRTRWLKNTLFEAQITIKNIKNIIEYKYVSCPDNEADLKWEEGPVNRTLDTSESNFLQVQEHFKVQDVDTCNAIYQVIILISLDAHASLLHHRSCLHQF